MSFLRDKCQIIFVKLFDTCRIEKEFHPVFLHLGWTKQVLLSKAIPDFDHKCCLNNISYHQENLHL